MQWCKKNALPTLNNIIQSVKKAYKIYKNGSSSMLINNGRILRQILEHFIKKEKEEKEKKEKEKKEKEKREKKQTRKNRIAQAFRSITNTQKDRLLIANNQDPLKRLKIGGGVTLEKIYDLIFAYALIVSVQLTFLAHVHGSRLYESEKEFLFNLALYNGTLNAEARCVLTAGFLNSDLFKTRLPLIKMLDGKPTIDRVVLDQFQKELRNINSLVINEKGILSSLITEAIELYPNGLPFPNIGITWYDSTKVFRYESSALIFHKLDNQHLLKSTTLSTVEFHEYLGKINDAVDFELLKLLRVNMLANWKLASIRDKIKPRFYTTTLHWHVNIYSNNTDTFSMHHITSGIFITDEGLSKDVVNVSLNDIAFFVSDPNSYYDFENTVFFVDKQIPQLSQPITLNLNGTEQQFHIDPTKINVVNSSTSNVIKSYRQSYANKHKLPVNSIYFQWIYDKSIPNLYNIPLLQTSADIYKEVLSDLGLIVFGKDQKDKSYIGPQRQVNASTDLLLKTESNGAQSADHLDLYPPYTVSVSKKAQDDYDKYFGKLQTGVQITPRIQQFQARNSTNTFIPPPVDGNNNLTLIRRGGKTKKKRSRRICR